MFILDISKAQLKTRCCIGTKIKIFFVSKRGHWDNYTLKSTESWSDRIKANTYIIKHKKSKISFKIRNSQPEACGTIPAEFW